MAYMNKNIEQKKLYSVVEVGKLLGIGKVKVYSLIKDGYLTAMNLGGLKVRKETIELFLEKYEGHDFKNSPIT